MLEHVCGGPAPRHEDFQQYWALADWWELLQAFHNLVDGWPDTQVGMGTHLDSTTLVNMAANLRCYFETHFGDKYLKHFLWNLGAHWLQPNVNIDSGNGLAPSGTKPMAGKMLTKVHNFIQILLSNLEWYTPTDFYSSSQVTLIIGVYCCNQSACCLSDSPQRCHICSKRSTPAGQAEPHHTHSTLRPLRFSLESKGKSMPFHWQNYEMLWKVHDQ